MSFLEFLFHFPILSVRDILQLAGVAPAADDAVGGAWVDAEGGSGLGVGLTVELWRQSFEELALLEGGSRGCGRGCSLSRVGFREGEEDVGVVAKDYGCHRHRALIVIVKAGQSVLDDGGGPLSRKTDSHPPPPIFVTPDLIGGLMDAEFSNTLKFYFFYRTFALSFFEIFVT